jgi:hypothetical protein
MMLDGISSGGQDGAEEAARQAAVAFGIPTGGWTALGSLAKPGPRPETALRQAAAEMPHEE